MPKIASSFTTTPTATTPYDRPGTTGRSPAEPARTVVGNDDLPPMRRTTGEHKPRPRGAVFPNDFQVPTQGASNASNKRKREDDNRDPQAAKRPANGETTPRPSTTAFNRTPQQSPTQTPTTQAQTQTPPQTPEQPAPFDFQPMPQRAQAPEPASRQARKPKPSLKLDLSDPARPQPQSQAGLPTPPQTPTSESVPAQAGKTAHEQSQDIMAQMKELHEHQAKMNYQMALHKMHADMANAHANLIKQHGANMKDLVR